MYDAELTFATELALEARRIALEYYKTDLLIVTKSDDSPVTIADQRINEMVIAAVKEKFPEDGVLGEEESWQLDQTRLWVCDPIDGTVAFTIGDPTFMFSIALVEDGVPVMAVTGDLANGDLFWAVKGQGAYMNGQRLKVSDRPLKDSWLAFPTNVRVLVKFQKLYLQLADDSYQTIMIHGMVYKGMMVAQGLCDGAVWPYAVKPWDAAAVKLIVEEAGGKVTAADGSEPRFDQVINEGLVIANQTIHLTLIDRVNKST